MTESTCPACWDSSGTSICNCVFCAIVIRSHFQRKLQGSQALSLQMFLSFLAVTHISTHFQPGSALRNLCLVQWRWRPLLTICLKPRLGPESLTIKCSEAALSLPSNAGPRKTDLLVLLLYSKGQIWWAESSLAGSCECSTSHSAWRDNPHGCFLLADGGWNRALENGAPFEIHGLAGITADRNFSCEMWFPSSCFFLLGYWGGLSVSPSLWQRTSAEWWYWEEK